MRQERGQMAHAEVEERQLLKAMTWWDGFVVALANPGFLIAALGASIGVLGTTGAFVLWTISVLLGALQNNVYAEMATMFPHKAGGISLYAHEAWRKYLSLIGPVATFGYWFAWSSVLAINGYVIGTLVQAEWFSDTTFTQDVGNFQWSLPVYIGIGCILAVWLFNIYGVRPAVWLSYVTGGRADPARGGAHVPAIPHRRLVQRQHDLGDRHRRWARPGHDLAVLHGLVGLWVRDRGGVRPRIPQSRVRHPEGAAGLRRLLCRGLCPVAAGRGRNARHGGDRGRRDGHRLLQGRLRRARRERSGTGIDRLPDRGAAAVDEHGHHGRLAGALRDRPRRDDDQVAGPAQQATACPASR